MAFGKVAQEKPYVALVELAFKELRSKAWRSQLSTVLRYASEVIGNAEFSVWLKEGGGIAGRYEEAQTHFGRSSDKAKDRLRSLRLQKAKETLSDKANLREFSHETPLAEGYYRSLVYSDGVNTYVVNVREDESSDLVNDYLLEIEDDGFLPEHPLKGKPLFELYRGVDLIVGTCNPLKPGNSQYLALWNEQGEKSAVTKLSFLCDARDFTSGSMTLAKPLPALNGRGVMVVGISDAETFRKAFGQNPNWFFAEIDGNLVLQDDASSALKIALKPYDAVIETPVRQVGPLKRKTRHFTASLASMRDAASNIAIFLDLIKKANADQKTPGKMPSRLRWKLEGDDLQLRISTAVQYDVSFVEFRGRAEAVEDFRELDMKEIAALLETTLVYGEDLSGYFADSNVADAAFCIDHVFDNGDRFNYVNPMLLSINRNRTTVCAEFAPLTDPTVA